MRTETQPTNIKHVLLEFENLRARLDEAEATLDAIRSGEVDALVVYGEQGEKVYTLKGAEQPYRVFVEQMLQGALTLGESGLILYANQSAANMLGVPLEKLIGCVLHEFIEERSRNDFAALMSEAERAGSSTAEIQLEHSAHSSPVLASVIRLQEDDDGHLAITLTDLSEHNRQERLIREKSDQLTAANKELEGFCYSVSHDLRAPLRSVVMGAMILREDFEEKLPGEAKEELERITRGANKLSALIDDLLKFSRLGRQQMTWHEVDLSSLAEGAVNDLRNDASKHIKFHVQEGLNATGDPTMLRMVLDNLLSNAIKFTKEKENGEIWFGAESNGEDNVYFVKDNGVGFDMVHSDKLFRPFERLHAENDYPGSGIGLANVQRILARHGGKIWAESAPDEGATFRFTLSPAPIEVV
jgi:PAS domain S-box-containing protein